MTIISLHTERTIIVDTDIRFFPDICLVDPDPDNFSTSLWSDFQWSTLADPESKNCYFLSNILIYKSYIFISFSHPLSLSLSVCMHGTGETFFFLYAFFSLFLILSRKLFLTFKYISNIICLLLCKNVVLKISLVHDHRSFLSLV